MADSRHYSRPNMKADGLGWLKWEYNRMRRLTMLRSAQFHYNASKSNSCSKSEVARGASCATFGFHAVYGSQFAGRCRIKVDGPRAKKFCITRFIMPLRRIHEAFTFGGGMPHSISFAAKDMVDAATTVASKVQAAYLAEVLLGWFERVRSVLSMRMGGSDDDSLMTPTRFYSDAKMDQAAYKWAANKVAQFNTAYVPARDTVPPRINLFMRWMNATPQPDGDSDNPADWDLGGGGQSGDSSVPPHHSDGGHHTGDSGDPPPPSNTPDPPDPGGTGDATQGAGGAPTPPDPPDHQGELSGQLATVPEDEAGEFPEEAEEREAPTIPSFTPSVAQDITAIAGVDLAKLFFTDMPMIQSVPARFWEQWARANVTVYNWVLTAKEGTEERTLALFWELLLHKLILRKSPRSRGKGRGPADTLEARFHAWATGDYQLLVKGLVKACNVAKLRKRTCDVNDEDGIQRRVEKLLAAGRFSKAFRLLDSLGQGNMGDQGVVDQLNVKHGPRMFPLLGKLPENLPGKTRLDKKLFAKGYRELKPLAGQGPDGYRYEYLSCLATSMACPRAKQAVPRHREFAESFINAELPSWYYYISCATKMIALIKSPAATEGGTPDVRPIGMGGCKRRAWTSTLMKQNAEVFKSEFWPVQVAVGVKAGVPKLIYAVSEHMHNNKGHALLKLDFTNAFNTVWRRSVLKACYENPAWRHLYRFFWCTLAPKSLIVGIDNLSEEGMQQGDPAGPAGFCMPIHKHAVWAHEQLQKVGGCVVMDMDDGYFLGPIETLLKVVEEFQKRLVAEVGSVLNPSKCKLWCHRQYRTHVNAVLQQGATNEFEMGVLKCKSGRMAYGVKVSGVPFGDHAYVREMMRVKVSNVVSQIKKLTARLQHCCQNLYSLLVQCLSSKLQFWMMCMKPAVLHRHLRKFDKVMLRAVQIATNQEFKGGSLARKRLRFPRRLRGGMIRSMVDVAKAAYVGGICQCVPSFTAAKNEEGVVTPGILDHMHQLYGQGSFDAGSEDSRFEVLLQGGSALGKDLRKYFNKMKVEVYGSTPCDELPADSPFAMGPEGAGCIHGIVQRRPQHEFTEARENARESGILEGLRDKLCTKEVAPSRQEAAFLSTNRLSTQFVGLPKMQRTVMDNTTFKECWSIYMGTASPICEQWIGEWFTDSFKRRLMVDEAGDNVARAMMPGDGWRTRHDAFKWMLAQQMSWCMYQARVEPNNLFLPWIKQRHVFLKTQKARKRQGMVPDFLDVGRHILMDVKGCTFGPTRYGPEQFVNAARCAAVEKRQADVHKEACRKAKKVDKDYNGWDKRSTTPGPMAQRLQDFGRVEGLVVGAHGEGSSDLIALIKRLATRGAMTRFRQMGFQSARSARSTVLNQLYLSLGVEAMRGMARLRIANLGTVLAGTTSAKAATARRHRAQNLYYEQNQAYWARMCYRDI